MFTLAGLIGVVVTLLVRTSRSFRQLDDIDSADNQLVTAPTLRLEAAA